MQVPVPFTPEFTCHWTPVICVGVEIVELAGLLKSVYVSRYVVAAVVGKARPVAAG